MLKSYIYILTVMLLMVVCINSIYTARKHAPAKIKALAVSVLIIEALRLIACAVLFSCDNIIFLYILKYFSHLNSAVVPIAALISFYIFYRSEKIRFDYVIIPCVLIVICYLAAVFNLDYYIKRTELYGYCIYFENWFYVQFIQIILLSFILAGGILALGRKVANNKGLMLVVMAAAAAAAEVVMQAFNVELLANCILGDAVWLLVLQYALNTMKYSKSR
ncbi:MAG: hypothetical protein Q8930_15335 [Bacillota bacterium]|nr:hypothetical protein [Bacillota bacterium]